VSVGGGGGGGGGGMDMAEDTVINFGVPSNAGNFLTS